MPPLLPRDAVDESSAAAALDLTKKGNPSFLERRQLLLVRV